MTLEASPCQDALDLYAWAIDWCTLADRRGVLAARQRDVPLPLGYLRIHWISKASDPDKWQVDRYSGSLRNWDSYRINQDLLSWERDWPPGASLRFPTLGEARSFGFGPEEATDEENEQPYAARLTPPHEWIPVQTEAHREGVGHYKRIKVEAQCRLCEQKQTFIYPDGMSDEEFDALKPNNLPIAPPENAQIGACVLRHNLFVCKDEDIRSGLALFKLYCQRCKKEFSEHAVAITENTTMQDVQKPLRVDPKTLGRCPGPR